MATLSASAWQLSQNSLYLSRFCLPFTNSSRFLGASEVSHSQDFTPGALPGQIVSVVMLTVLGGGCAEAPHSGLANQNPVDGFFSLPLSSIPRRHLGRCGECLVTRKTANSRGGAAEITLLPSQWCQAQPSCPRCPPALSVGHVTMTDLGVCKVKLFLPVPYTNRSGLLLHTVSILN